MSVATSTGIAIALAGASAAGSLAKAKIQSNAAKKAAATQSGGADQAMGAQTEAYNRQMTAMQPYANLGRGAANTLGRVMTPGVPYTGGMQRQDARMIAQENQPAPAMAGPMAPQGGRPMGGRPMQGPAQPMMGGPRPAMNSGGMGPGGGGMVQLRAPDGSVQSVQAHLADQFVAKGATRI